jgi:hypothetical protein
MSTTAGVDTRIIIPQLLVDIPSPNTPIGYGEEPIPVSIYIFDFMYSFTEEFWESVLNCAHLHTLILKTQCGSGTPLGTLKEFGQWFQLQFTKRNMQAVVKVVRVGFEDITEEEWLDMV